MIFSQNMCIDLGTATTLVYVKGRGIVLREPSVVAVDIRSSQRKVVAVGNTAKEMIGRTPGSIVAVRPLKDGVIADFDMTADMLRALMKKALNNSPFNRTKVMICVPTGITEVERRAVHDAAKNAGARYVSLIEVPMAAAIGAGLPITSATGSMIVDIGGGTTEVAVISLGDIVNARSIRCAGDAFDSAIVAYIRKKHNLLIGERTAEDIKLKIGSAYPYEGEGAVTVKGRNLIDGLPKNVEITSQDVRQALTEPINRILDIIRSVLEKTPPELAGDLCDRGIVMTGGSSLLRGFDRLLQAEVGLKVMVAASPQDCAALGGGKCLDKNVLEALEGK
ncbi:MAG: rod shape-determining protein [Clostridia bacterium]|nr:rod shape-determining protein [Clostridia bacterium]